MKKRRGTLQSKTLAEWAGAAEPEQLIQLTVLFTDIIGSTRKSYEMGDGRWIRKLIKHFAHARTFKRRYRCYEVKIIGDSFMVAFQNAYDALNFGIELLYDTGDEDIKIRVGINSGMVCIIDNDIYGGTVNYASRVTNSQKTEGIALSESAKEHVQNQIGDISKQIFEPVDQPFKDYPTPKRIWHVNCSEYWNLKIKQDFSSLDNIYRETNNMKYQINQAKEDELEWISTIETAAYGLDAVPLQILRGWYRKNPTGFFIIKDKDGQNVGHLDVLPLRPDILNHLLEGEITERDIDINAIYTPSEKDQIQDLYIESVITLAPSKFSKASILSYLLSEFEILVAKICNPVNLNNIYALAATFAGQRLMNDLGFEVVKDGNERKDGHPFYKANYKDIVAKINK